MKRVILTLLSFALIAVATASGTSPEIGRRMADIEDMLERNRWADAERLLVELRGDLDGVKDRFDMEWVDYRLVRCAMELGVGDAEAMMENFIEEYPSSVHANRMQFMLGTYLCDEGKLKAADEVLDKVDYDALDAREKERYDIRMGYIQFIQGDYLTATQRFMRIGKHSIYAPHATYYLSYINYTSERYAEARRGFESLADVEPYNVLVPHYLLQIEYREGNYGYVVEHGEKLLNSVSGDVRSDLVRIIAESYYQLGDYARSVIYISDLSEDNMGRHENYIKGYSLYRSAQYQAAIEPLVKVCGSNDALTQNASYHLGDCYLRCGDKQSAVEAFAMASTECEGCDEQMAEDALLNYGRLKFELGGDIFNESINVLQSYLQRYPYSAHVPEVRALLVAAYYNAKDYDAAYIAIKELDSQDNDIRSALQKVSLYRAVDAMKRGDVESAAALIDESSQIGLISKYSALALFWQGEVSYAQGDMHRAVDSYSAYMRRAPQTASEYAMARYGMGYSLFAQEKMGEAAKSFESFVREYAFRDSYLYDAHNRIGDSYFAVREFGKARKAYNVVASSSSDERTYANYRLALIDGVESKQKSKIERLKTIVDEGNGDYVDDAWYELARTYINAERYADGVATLREFIAADTLSPYYVPAMSDLGLAYYNTNNMEDALRCYERVVAYDPQSSAAMEAMRGIREIYVKEGNIDGYFAYAERSGVQSDMSAAARDSLTFAAAKSAYLDGSIGVAEAKLHNYLESFKSGYNRTDALFYLSDCYLQNGNNEQAMATMSELLAHGRSQYSERVLSVLAPMSFDAELYEQSARSYRELYDVATSHSVRQRASEGYVDAVLALDDNEQTIAMADAIQSMSDATVWARNHSQLKKAYAVMAKGDDVMAVNIFESLAAQRNTAEGAEAYYRLIEAQYNAANYDIAEQMVYDFGECGSVYWQAKAFILLGDVMVQRGNNYQARATYQSVVDGYSPKDDGIVDEAKERINSLK